MRNSLTWIGSSRLALIAMRRKFATETPGIDDRVLEGEEEAGLGALVRLGLGDVLAVEE